MALFDNLEKRLQRTLPNARIETTTIPDTTISLGLINADFSTEPLSQTSMNAVLAEPAYWSFCWGSGRGLAEFLTRHREIVTDADVLDVGSGSGIAGIAAAKLGAKSVTALDSDADALAATRANAALNGVDVAATADIVEFGKMFDVALLADVLYDKANFDLIEQIEAIAETLVIADSRIRDLDAFGFKIVERYESVTLPNLGEFDEFKTVNIFLKD